MSAKITAAIRIRVAEDGPRKGQWLRYESREHVRKLGYGFTDDPACAWEFSSLKKAEQKLRVLNRHFGFAVGLEKEPDQ